MCNMFLQESKDEISLDGVLGRMPCDVLDVVMNTISKNITFIIVNINICSLYKAMKIKEWD